MSDIAVPDGPDADERIQAHRISSAKIESGNCPNNCGKLAAEDWGQSCPVCNFSCNIFPTKENMQ